MGYEDIKCVEVSQNIVKLPPFCFCPAAAAAGGGGGGDDDDDDDDDDDNDELRD
jgi:hypothetical protein